MIGYHQIRLRPQKLFVTRVLRVLLLAFILLEMPFFTIASFAAVGWPAPSASATVATGIYDGGCLKQNNYYIPTYRALVVYNNVSFIQFEMFMNNLTYCGVSPHSADSVGFEDSTYANHPAVLLCKAINTSLSLPGGLTYAASGIPYLPASVSIVTSTSKAGSVPSEFPPQPYCHLPATSGTNIQILRYDFTG